MSTATSQDIAENGGRAVFEAINGPPPGQFLETKHGTTHYVLEGPPDGKLLILQHGLGGNLSVFDKIASKMASQNFRVLRYDLYDRGYSQTDPKRYPIGRGIWTGSSHPIDFTLEVYVEQLREVLIQLELENQDMIHIGHSNGGVTGIGYASKYPDKVKGLCLISSVCLPAQKPLAARVADLPILGALIVYFLGANAMIKFSTNSCHNPKEFPEIQDFLDKLARNTRENKRYFASIRSTNGNCKGFVGSAEDEFRQVCQSKIPMHLIWGKEDASVPYSQCLALQETAKSYEGLAVT